MLWASFMIESVGTRKASLERPAPSTSGSWENSTALASASRSASLPIARPDGMGWGHRGYHRSGRAESSFNVPVLGFN